MNLSDKFRFRGDPGKPEVAASRTWRAAAGFQPKWGRRCTGFP
jgi:hypothetical protein